MAAPQESYVNSVQRRGYSDARIRPADFGASGEIIGRAVEGFGKDLGAVASNVADIQEQDAITAAQNADNVRLARRMQFLYDGDNGYFNKSGLDAMQAAQTAPQDLKKIDDDVAASLLKSNPQALRLYQNATAKRNQDDLPRIWQHEHTQRVENEKAVDGAAFDLAIDNAATSQDPVIIEQNLATVGNIAVKQQLRNGVMDSNVLAQTRQTAVGKAVAAVAQRMELKSPSEAQAFVTAHAGVMDPQDAATLLEALAPSAAKENADANVDQFLVPMGSAQAPAATAGTAPASSAGAPKPTPIPDAAALDAAQWSQESGGQHFGPNGQLLQSYNGSSQGISQLFKGNRRADGSWDFGYGVVGPRDNSRAEYIRVGRDYRNALLKHYNGNIVLALTAYNWGPGNVEKHMRQVGDPRKGQISDAAFVNSISDRDARSYAANVLHKVGVNVGSSAAGEAPSAHYIPSTQEIDLQSTIASINASDKTYVEKQALIEAASRRATFAKEAVAQVKEDLTDQAWQSVSNLGDNFTDYSDLPLELRRQIHTINPRFEVQLQGMAESNKNAQQAKLDAANAKEEKAREDATVEDLIELSWQNPDAFSKIDLRTSHPELSHGARISLMDKQQAYLKSRDQGKGPDYSAMRTMFNQYVGPAVKNDRARMGFNFQEALRQEQLVLSDPARNGKPLTDVEREAIVRRVLMPVVLHSDTGNRVVTRAEAPREAHALGSHFKGADADLREQARSAFILRNKRIPSDYELDQAVEQWKALHPSGYQYGAR